MGKCEKYYLSSVNIDEIKAWLKKNQFGKYFLIRDLLAWLEKKRGPYTDVMEFYKEGD